MFVSIIDNLFGNSSSVYLWNYLWRSKELFLSWVFVELALKGERMKFIY